MTYVNPVYRHGFERVPRRGRRARGSRGSSCPTCRSTRPGRLDRSAAPTRGIDAVLLAAPGTSTDRLAAIAEGVDGLPLLRGDVRGDGRPGELAGTARELVSGSGRSPTSRSWWAWGSARLRRPPRPVTFADGVIVGTALMARLVEGDRAGCSGWSRPSAAALP